MNNCRSTSANLLLYENDLMAYIIIFLLASLLPLFAVGQQESSQDSSWSFSASGYHYLIPDAENTITLICYADHKKLHLEARYNYEDQRTGSVFAGWRVAKDGKFQWAAIPMLGGVFGNKEGIAPGLELEAAYKKFGFYSETEYVFDFAGNENNFLYTWGELSYTPIEVLNIGFSFQRTLLYQADLEVQRGIMAKYFPGKLSTGLYYFNPFSDDNLLILMLSFEF
jgi:hypothetical protein